MWKLFLFGIMVMLSSGVSNASLKAESTHDKIFGSPPKLDFVVLEDLANANPKIAVENATKLLEMPSANHSQEEKSRLIGIQAMGHARQGHFEIALALAENAENFIQDGVTSPITQGYIYSALGKAKEGLGYIPEAMRAYQQALQLYNDIAYQRGMATANIDIANLFVSVRLFDKAIEDYQKALSLLNSDTDSFLYIRALNNLGFSLKQTGDAEQALTYLITARNLALSKGSTLTVAYTTSNVGEAYYHTGQYDLAETFTQQALEKALENDLVSLATSTYHYLGLIALARGNVQTSENYAEKALNAALKYNDITNLVSIYDLLAKIAIAQGDYKSAITYRDQNLKYLDELTNENTVTALSLLQSEYSLRESQQQITLLQRDNEIQKFSLREERNFRILGLGLVVLLSFGVAALLYVIRVKSTASELALVREKDLTTAKLAAESANVAKSQFLSYMSHELRTPLNAVIGFSESLRLAIFGEMNEKQVEYVNYIHQSGTLLLKLINDLLHLSKIESGAVELNLQQCDIKRLILEIIPTVDHLLKNNQVRLHAEGIASDLPSINVDKIRMDQILVNLISNAIKYGRKNGNVWISAEHQDHKMLRISIRDDGVGIPPDQFANVFMPFHRAGKEESGIEGTGAGLAIVKGLVEAMGASIDFASQPNIGSTFWIDFPVSEYKTKGLSIN